MVSCNDLLSLNIFKTIKLVAGERGIYKTISWPYICQSIDFEQWVNGRELMFLTGMGMALDEYTLIQFVNKCIAKDIAGVVILTGSEYLEAIPQSVINVADEVGLPLFEMPWQLKLIDVSKEIANYLMTSNLNQNRDNELLKALLFSDDLDELKIRHLISKYPIHIATKAFVANFNLGEEEVLEADILANKIKSNFEEKGLRGLVGTHEKCISCVLFVKDVDDYRRSKEILKTVHQDLIKNRSITLSIGRQSKSLLELNKSYKEANRAYKLARCNDWNLIKVDYETLGFYKVLFEINDLEMLREYAQKVLGNLMQSERSIELLETLRVYLMNDCNLVKTSKALFIHRNTLIYRLNKIKNQLKGDLEEPLFKNELMNVMMIGDYLKYKEKEQWL